MTGLATRGEAFRLVADGVAAGLSAPWRLYLARGCRYLSMSVGEREEWDAWRAHLGCPVMTVRVYDVAGDVRRASVAEAVIDGCRISVELVEDISTGDLAAGIGRLDQLEQPRLEPPPTGGRPIIPSQSREDERGSGTG
jgi:hypothetical protein